MEMVDVSSQLQSPRLVELLHAAHDSSHSTVLVFSQIAYMAQESAVRTLTVSTACFLFFCAIAAMDYWRLDSQRRGK